jgi:hypothetical protein
VMAGKVTLYVRDEDLWERARQASGRGGLSDVVQQCLRRWLEESRMSAPAPSPLERARRLRDDAGTLVRALEHEGEPPRSPRERGSPRRSRKDRSN